MNIWNATFLSTTLLCTSLFGGDNSFEVITKDFACGLSQQVTEKVTSGSLVLRELTTEDFNAGFTETLSAIKQVDVSLKKAYEIFNERITQGIRSYVVEDCGLVVATASMLIETKFYRNGGKVAHVEDVAINPDYQGMGFGKLIMRCLEKEATSLGCYKMILDCSDYNVGFYEKNGYKKQESQMRLDLL